ncbi:MAG: hypothetical protein JSR19_06975 [Proteobacteria bacterium]|nr:hypothetical protein [Pseudomonadota bacterium]
MPKYRVLELSFIDARLVPAGEEIEFAGDPGPNLEPLDDEAREAQRVYLEVKEPARIAKMASDFGTAGIADQEAFAKALAKANAEANADVIAKQVAEGIAAAFAQFFPNGLNKPPAAPVAPAAPEAGHDLT